MSNQSDSNLDIRLSPIDEERFGVRTGRALILAEDALQQLIDYCDEQQLELLIVRCPTSAIYVAQALEALGCQIMDTLVYYKRSLDKTPLPDRPSTPLIRSAQDGDLAGIKVVAETAFKDYFGHYHADRRLDPAKADEGYVSWAVRSSTMREVSDDVLIAIEDDTILGFATMKLNSPEQGEGILFGVAPQAQGRGIYRSFIVHGLHWCKERGANEMIVSTQITNIAVQKVWVRTGFELAYGYYTFHKWFERS